jgi:hypothetical protein
VLSAVKTKNLSTSSHLYITKHERQGKKQRRRERNKGRGGKQGCRGGKGKKIAEYMPRRFGKVEEARGIPGRRGST